MIFAGCLFFGTMGFFFGYGHFIVLRLSLSSELSLRTLSLRKITDRIVQTYTFQ